MATGIYGAHRVQNFNPFLNRASTARAGVTTSCMYVLSGRGIPISDMGTRTKLEG